MLKGKERYAAIVLVCLVLSGCGGGESRAIERVLSEQVALAKRVGNVPGFTAQLRSVNLAGCPGEFREAFTAQIQAWEQLARVQEQARQNQAHYESGNAVFESFVRGALGDPFGKMQEAMADSHAFQQAEQTALGEVRRTMNVLEQLAARYGAKVPQ